MGSYFSLAQWQELELQDLIYRYMLAGTAVPSELLQPIKKSVLDPPTLCERRSFRCGVDRDDRGWTTLHIGARKGDLNQVKQLLSEGMDVNVAAWGPKSQGVTPFHLAAEGGHLQVMDELLERGANIDARTKGACGWTPLHTAAKERKKVVKLLIDNGASLPDDMNDGRFNPPPHYRSCAFSWVLNPHMLWA